MKRTFKLIPIALFCICTLKMQAQTDVDLLRYSQLNISGNARFTAMSGAFGALGANFSALSTNPAAIGLYSKHEVSITGALSGNNTRSKYLDGKMREDGGLSFNVPSGGMVFVVYEGSQLETNAWRRIQLGFGVNRMNDYNNNTYIEGFNAKNSMVDKFIQNANGINPGNLNGFYEGMAYQLYLLDPIDSVKWLYDSPIKGGNVNQKKILESYGATTEMVFTVGSNYSDKLYLGATIGVPFIYYSEYSTYKETNTENLPFYRPFQSFTFSEKLQTRGTGINVKLGLIYKPVDFFRLGFAVHSPTYYYMKDNYQTGMKVDMTIAESPDAVKSQSKSGYYAYNIITPMRALLSLGFVIGTRGSVDIEGEFIDYRHMKLRAQDNFAYDVNDVVRNKYVATGNLRIGTEWRVNPVSFRAGYAMQGNPYSKDFNSEFVQHGVKHSYSLGLGFNRGPWSLDLAFQQQFGKQNYYLYNLENNKNIFPASLEQSKYIISFTLGFKF
ncbi:MAG: hypothetical protein RR328_00125 [Bacteroidales bacterium]